MHAAYCFAWVDEEAKEEAPLELYALVSNRNPNPNPSGRRVQSLREGQKVVGSSSSVGGRQRKTHRSKFPRGCADTSTSSVGLCSSFCRTISCLLLAGAENCFPLGSASRFPNPTIGIVVLGFKNEDLTKKTPVPPCLRQPSKCSTSLCLSLSPSVFFSTCSS
jgi:hypothetical protein